MKKSLRYFFAIVLAGFGLLTLFLSTSVIFDLFGIRAREGNFVLIIVWANFICSLLYLFAAYGFVSVRSWTPVILVIAVLILVGAFIALQFHISSGGLYETKTIKALIFRIGVTLLFTLLANYSITRNKTEIHI